MKIDDNLNYDVSYDELANEFCEHNSGYQAETINEIGFQFKLWSHDRPNTTHEQIVDIVEHLDDNGKWFVKELCKCILCECINSDV